MHTVNTRQLRALAAIAPGPLALHHSSTFALQHWLLTVEDADRCGYYMLTVNQNGDVAYSMNESGATQHESYAEIMNREDAVRAELEAEARIGRRYMDR